MPPHNVITEMNKYYAAGGAEPADFRDVAPKMDAIAESTSGTGVTVDGVLMKDSGVTAAGVTSTAITNTVGFLDTDNEAIAATTGGGTTGLIPAGTTFCTVTSDSADKQISLPLASVGQRLAILVGATGCELISAVAGHKVNNVVVGATNEAALVATTTYYLHYVAEDTWTMQGITNLGAVETPVVPNAL
jgi:hypothetical protein